MTVENGLLDESSRLNQVTGILSRATLNVHCNEGAGSFRIGFGCGCVDADWHAYCASAHISSFCRRIHIVTFVNLIQDHCPANYIRFGNLLSRLFFTVCRFQKLKVVGSIPVRTVGFWMQSAEVDYLVYVKWTCLWQTACWMLTNGKKAAQEPQKNLKNSERNKGLTPFLH